MSAPTKVHPITAVENKDTGNIVAYFTHIPGLIVQGKTLDDVKFKLRFVLEKYIKRLQSTTDFEVHTNLIHE